MFNGPYAYYVTFYFSSGMKARLRGKLRVNNQYGDKFVMSEVLVLCEKDVPEAFLNGKDISKLTVSIASIVATPRPHFHV